MTAIEVVLDMHAPRVTPIAVLCATCKAYKIYAKTYPTQPTN
jgi:hypothetical protein